MKQNNQDISLPCNQSSITNNHTYNQNNKNVESEDRPDSNSNCNKEDNLFEVATGEAYNKEGQCNNFGGSFGPADEQCTTTKGISKCTCVDNFNNKNRSSK